MRNLRSTRLPLYDYQSNGYYFVTIVSDYRKPFFNNRESFIEGIIRRTIQKLRGISVDTIVVMSDHVHCIIVLDNAICPLGEVIRKIKAAVSHTLGHRAWQPNYYEHVIRTETALNRIREYIMNNTEMEISDFKRFY